MIEIDGSVFEGGGQMLRTALAFSAFTGESFTMLNIRKNRNQPGLKQQHLTCVTAVKSFCNAYTEGEELGSTSLKFIPRKLEYKNQDIDIGTAGSVTLLLQSLLPFAIFSSRKIKIQIKGGTDTQHSMPIDYFSNVFMPHLRRYCDYNLELEKRGYYPKGGGNIILKLRPKYAYDGDFLGFIDKLRRENISIDLTKKGKLMAIKGISHASKDLMDANVSERQARSAEFELSEFNADIDISYSDTLSTGSGITLWALFSKGDELDFNNPVILGADALGERGKKSEVVGKEAAQKLKESIQTEFPLDNFLADQILPYMAIFGGNIKVSFITEHAKANMYIIEKFLGKKFRVEGNMISC